METYEELKAECQRLNQQLIDEIKSGKVERYSLIRDMTICSIKMGCFFSDKKTNTRQIWIDPELGIDQEAMK